MTPGWTECKEGIEAVSPSGSTQALVINDHLQENCQTLHDRNQSCEGRCSWDSNICLQRVVAWPRLISPNTAI